MKIYSRVTAAVFILGMWLGVVPLYADGLVYEPINPNFGGSPFNAAPLLNSALAQNDFKAPTTPRTTLTATERFQQSLDRAILSRLASNLVSEAFGGTTGELLDGTIPINNGDSTLQIITVAPGGTTSTGLVTTSGGTEIIITDLATGDVSSSFAPTVGAAP